MLYQMRQKLLSWGNDFTIQDADGRDRFFVDGAAFSIGNKLSFQSMGGAELAYIRQKLLAWGPTYEIHRDGHHYATVKKELFRFFSTKFEVDIPGPEDLHVEGNFWEYDYRFERVTDGRCVALVSKEFFSWGDSYGIDVEAGEDDVLVLATAVVIDQVCHERKK